MQSLFLPWSNYFWHCSYASDGHGIRSPTISRWLYQSLTGMNKRAYWRDKSTFWSFEFVVSTMLPQGNDTPDLKLSIVVLQISIHTPARELTSKTIKGEKHRYLALPVEKQSILYPLESKQLRKKALRNCAPIHSWICIEAKSILYFWPLDHLQARIHGLVNNVVVGASSTAACIQSTFIFSAA